MNRYKNKFLSLQIICQKEFNPMKLEKFNTKTTNLTTQGFKKK